MKNNSDLIFAFDLGTGSIGSCVRKGDEIKYLDVKLLPAEFASTKEQAKKRRMVRTRIAHKEREKWWREQAQLAGIEVLESRQPTKEEPNIKPDERLLRSTGFDANRRAYHSAFKSAFGSVTIC